MKFARERCIVIVPAYSLTLNSIYQFLIWINLKNVMGLHDKFCVPTFNRVSFGPPFHGTPLTPFLCFNIKQGRGA